MELISTWLASCSDGGIKVIVAALTACSSIIGLISALVKIWSQKKELARLQDRIAKLEKAAKNKKEEDEDDDNPPPRPKGRKKSHAKYLVEFSLRPFRFKIKVVGDSNVSRRQALSGIESSPARYTDDNWIEPSRNRSELEPTKETESGWSFLENTGPDKHDCDPETILESIECKLDTKPSDSDCVVVAATGGETAH